MHSNCRQGAGAERWPVSAFSVESLVENYEAPVTKLREGAFNLVMRGLIAFEVDKGLWMVPPQCALWIPGGMARSFRSSGSLEFCGLLIAPEVTRKFPRECCTMAVSPLLRELVIATAQLPKPYTESRATRAFVLADAIRWTSAQDCGCASPYALRSRDNRRMGTPYRYE